MRIAVLAVLAGTFGFGAANRIGASAQSRVNPSVTIQLAQAAPSQARLVREGRFLFVQQCVRCHGTQGQGGSGPKLAENSFVRSRMLIVAQILDGRGSMPPFGNALNDRQTAAIATYVRNSWGNGYGIVLPDYVAIMR